MRKLLVLALLATTLALAGRSSPASAASPIAPPGFSVAVYNNLGMQPYGLTNFITLPGDGRTMLALAKYGDVHRLTISADEQTMQSNVIGHIPVYYQGDRGLLGISLSANYAADGGIYLLYDYTQGNRPTGRLQTFTVANPLAPTSITPGAVLRDDLPSYSENPDATCTDSHTIGTVVTAPDGTLFFGNGDGSGYCGQATNSPDFTSLQAQDVASPRGKIFHINADGSPAADTIGGTNGVWAYGLRNPFRFNLAAGSSNTLILGDVGWDTTEELDVVHAGDNLGWPCLEGTVPPPVYPSHPEWQAVCSPQPASVTPVYTWQHVIGFPGSAAVGGAMYTADQYPLQYQGAEFFGDYGRGQIYIRDTNGNVSTFGGGSWGALTAIHTGRDGDIFVGDISANNNQSDQTSQIIRIHYNAGQPSNQLPVAMVQASPDNGTAPVTVNFSSVGSFDPDGEIISYTWDFGDGTVPTSGEAVSHRYQQRGVYNAKLTVTDNQGGVSVAVATIDASNTAPTVAVVQPTGPFHIGDTVHVQATASDPDGDAVVVSYQSVLHHCQDDGVTCHTHPGAVQSSPDFVIPDHGTNFYLAVLVIATDSRGAFNTQEVFFTVDTTPPGGTPVPPLLPPPVGQPSPPFSNDLTYQQIAPWRVLDTRNTGQKLRAGVPLVFNLAGQQAAVLNLTVTQPNDAGFLRVYPCTAQTQISSINYSPGQTISNMAFVTVPPSGDVCVVSQRTTHLVVDEMGSFTAGDGLRYQPVTPQRLLDTRTGPSLGAMEQAVYHNPSAPDDAKAMLATMTGDQPQANGFVRAYPCGAEDNTSNVNYTAGQTIANFAAIDMVGGTSCFRSFVPTDLVVDLAGFFSPTGSIYKAVEPFRLFDTRSTSGFSRLQPNWEAVINMSAALPAGATAMAINVTAADPSANGYVQVYPCGTNATTSVMNYAAHDVAVAGMTVVQVPPDTHYVCFKSYAATDLIVDMMGTFSG